MPQIIDIRAILFFSILLSIKGLYPFSLLQVHVQKCLIIRMFGEGVLEGRRGWMWMDIIF